MMNPLASYKLLVGLVLVVSAAVLLPQPASAQSAARPDRGLVPGASYSVSDTETISLTNGNLNLSIPLASLPPIAGGKLNFSLSAIYNSKLWNITRVQHQLPPISNCGSWVVDTPQIGDAGGWRIGGGYQIQIRDARDDFDYYIPNPPPPEDPCFGDLTDQVLLQNRYYRVVLIGPDGAEHELRPIDHTSSAYSGSGSSFLFNHFSATPETVGGSMRYYSVDGSYLWAVINPSSNPIRWSVYLNDGTKVTQYSDGIQRISDTNGNSIKIFGDAQGGHIQDEQTGREIRTTYDPGANGGWGQLRVIYKTVTGVEQTIEINYGTTRVEGLVYPVQDWSEFGGETGGGMVCQKHDALFSDLYVIRSIVFPATEPGVPSRRFEFDYNSDEKETVTNEVRWACMTMPEQYTRQASKGLGALSEMTTPTGAVVKYEYSRDENYIYLFNADDIPRETVKKKTITHDGTSEEWNYDIIEFNACGGTVTGPDGSVTTESCEPRDSGYGNYSMSNPKGGLVLRTNNSNKVLVERHWTLMKFNGGNGAATGNYGEIPFNPVVDAEYTTLLENGAAVKMLAKTFQYDFNGNLISQTEYDWFDPTGIPRDAAGVPMGVPAGATVLRVTNNAYYNDSTSAYSTNVYAKRALGATPLILSALQQSTVGPAITQFSYDGQPYGSPPTAGNLTRKRAWNNIANEWIDVERTYGLYGNLASIIDGRDKVTQLFYDDAAHALPTRVVVDPQNGTGTHTTTTEYDYYTGLVTNTIDPNGKRSDIDYTNQLLGTIDPFGRPGVAIGPTVEIDGVNQRHRTKTIYEDNARIVTVLADMRSENDGLLKSQTISDMLGRTVESRHYESASAFIAVRQSYDLPNRLSRTSNPFRTGEAVLWTATASDAVGRVISVTTPDNASVAMAYYADRVLMTDQAGKQRISASNAIGQLKDIWEVTGADAATEAISFPNHPEVTAGYRTSYTYDELENLTTVSQGGQTRTFVYDSLKRLVSSSNPENGTVCYGAVLSQQCQNNGYDNNGNLTRKTDARGVVTNYGYDALNRVISRSYSDGTPAVSYNYDTATNGKGRLASVSSSVSTYGYNGYDTLGRAQGATQTIGAQSYSLTYTYDLAGHVKKMSYPSGHEVTYNYDGAGRLADKDAQNLAFTGNIGGAPRTYASGISYSSFGGVQEEKFGTTTTIYQKRHYNIRGQLYDARVSTLSWAQNELDWNRGAVSLYYGGAPWGQSSTTNNGNLTMQQHWSPLNEALSNYVYTQQSYTYDSLNRLTSVSELHGGPGSQSGIDYTQGYDYDRFGNRRINLGGTSGSGINNLQTWIDPVSNRLYASGDQNISDPEQRLIRYDAAGNQKTDYYSPNWNGTRTHDAENRMTSTTSTSNNTSSYVYDGDGRRIKRIVNTTETWQVYGISGEVIAEYANNSPAASPQKEYGYRNGELLITATITSGWGAPPSFTDNPLNPPSSPPTEMKLAHLTELRAAVNALRSHAGLTAYSFTVDPNPQQYVTTVKADHLRQLRTALEQARLQLGLSTGGYAHPTLTENSSLIYAVDFQELRDQVLSAWQSGGGVDIRWLVTDHLGTPRMIFDQTGSLANVSRHDYLPFGEEVPGNFRNGVPGYAANDGVRQKFTGYENDTETGLNFAQARYQSATQGRFMSPDPILSSGVPTNPQTWNRYSYCLNNPIAYVDPTGMWNWSAALGGDLTDDEIREQMRQIGEDASLTDEEKCDQIGNLHNILMQRQAFRDALKLAKDIVARADISNEEAGAYSAFLRTYGTESDGNGVVVAVSNASGVAFTREENGKIIVAITAGQLANRDSLWGAVFHESVHVFQSRFRGLFGANPSLASAETQAYFSIANLVRGLDSVLLRHNAAPPNQSYSAGSPPVTLWQRGWTEVDMRNGIKQHLHRLGHLDNNGNETPKGAAPAFPGGGKGQWQ